MTMMNDNMDGSDYKIHMDNLFSIEHDKRSEALRSLAHVVNRPEVQDEIIKKLLENISFLWICDTITMLSRYCDRLPVRQCLVKIISETNSVSVGIQALKITAKSAFDPVSQQILLDVLGGNKLPGLRTFAASALREVAHLRQPQQLLVHAALGDPDDKVREAAVYALFPVAHCSNPRRALLEVMKKDRHPSTRLAAAMALVPHLRFVQDAAMTTLRSDSQDEARSEAAKVLSRAAHLPNPQRALIRSMATDSCQYVRGASAQSLCGVSHLPGPHQALLEAFMNDKAPFVRAHAANSLSYSLASPAYWLFPRKTLRKIIDWSKYEIAKQTVNAPERNESLSRLSAARGIELPLPLSKIGPRYHNLTFGKQWGTFLRGLGMFNAPGGDAQRGDVQR